MVPSGWTYNETLGTLDVTGRDVEATKKFRDVVRTGRAAIVIDGVAEGQGWSPWAIEIAGRAEAVTGPPALIRIHPGRVRSWASCLQFDTHQRVSDWPPSVLSATRLRRPRRNPI